MSCKCFSNAACISISVKCYLASARYTGIVLNVAHTVSNAKGVTNSILQLRTTRELEGRGREVKQDKREESEGTKEGPLQCVLHAA